MSNPTTADLIAMQVRLAANHKAVRFTPDHVAQPRTMAKREVGKGGIQDDIEQWLRSFGTACYWIRSRTDMRTTNAIGTPDFVGWLQGRPFALEVKRPGRKETREQAGELMRARLAGAIVAIVHSLEEAKAAMAVTSTKSKA